MTSRVPFQISIDRASMTLPALLLKNDRTTPLTLVSWREPAIQPRIKYAPTSDWVHGETALGFSYQQVILAFTVAAYGATSEAAAQAAIADLTAAVSRLNFPLTRETNGYDETWTCQPGTVAPAGDRTYADLRDHDPAWAISIPAYPIRSYS